MPRPSPPVSKHGERVGSDGYKRGDRNDRVVLKRPPDIARLLSPIDRSQYLLRGKLYMRRGLLGQADAILRRGSLKYPDDKGLAIGSAKVATARKDWPEAVTRWRKVVKTIPVEDALSAYRALSQAYRHQAQFDAADAVLCAAKDLYPEDLQVAMESAEVAGLRKSWHDAVARWSGLLEKFGEAAPLEALVSLSKAYRALGQFEAAEATVQRAHRSSPALAMEYADVAMARQEFPEAIKRWNRAFAQFGKNMPSDARLRLALAYRLQGDWAGASEQLELAPRIVLSGYGPIAQTIRRDAAFSSLPEVRSKVCVQLHLYHIALAELYFQRLSQLATPFALFISVPQNEQEAFWQERASRALPLAAVDVKAVPNRGRDVMPWLCTFADQIRNYDLMLHMHTKASQSSKAVLWHDFLLDHVCGSLGVIYSILDLFERDPKLGLVYPPYFLSLKRQPNWDGSGEACRELYVQLFSEPLPTRCPDYPAGSFFWARTRYLKPLLDLSLSAADFLPEEGKVDNTLAHAVERIIGALGQCGGMTKKCIATVPTLTVGGKT